MLWTRDSDKPPLSAILPRLYLGAESDVTQDCLSSLGISYVLSVSRCSPQPSFLPRSRYLRIPIDDSLWDDLLPWIPEALTFIDGAMSSGASVLVHCAAGISRSPALAVAYIMYRLGLDLDQAYRFVKERRPSISPNFNFLGQLQLFQSTLSLNGPAGGTTRHHQEDRNHGNNCQEDCNRGNSEHQTDCICAHNEIQFDRNSAHHNQGAGLQTASETTERTVHRCQDGDDGRFNKTERQATPPSKPSTLQLPASSASLREKRRSLTLTLTPLGVNPPSAAGGALTSHSETKDMSHKDREDAHRKEQSPFSLGLNKLLDWGERLLLGGLFVAPVKMGQPALPYRC